MNKKINETKKEERKVGRKKGWKKERMEGKKDGRKKRWKEESLNDKTQWMGESTNERINE